MNAKPLLTIIIFAIATPAWAAAPTIDQLIASPTLLNAEMDRCKQRGMAAFPDLHPPKPSSVKPPNG